MTEPWKDWLPGVLAPRQLRELEKAGLLDGVDFDASPPDGSAFDLHLTDKVWILKGGSVKPAGDIPYSVFLKELGEQQPSKSVYTLERNTTYVFELRERLKLADSGIHGQATARSSVGRMDVLVRLIVDGMDGYEGFKPTGKFGYNMYVEVTPMTFPVRVRVGHALSQLRLFYGAPDQCIIRGKELARTINTKDETLLHVDLRPEEIGSGRHKTIAFQAKRMDMTKPIDLWKEEGARGADPCDYWKFCKSDQNQRLKIERDAFYIFRSTERLTLPGGVAAYCIASDETIGEMRIHYAGFVHPWFGRNRNDGKDGTPLIFEVRGHDLSVNLRHNEVLARMIVYRMSEDVPKPKSKSSDYDEQELKLSGYFDKWPDNLLVGDDGSVKRE